MRDPGFVEELHKRGVRVIMSAPLPRESTAVEPKQVARNRKQRRADKARLRKGDTT